MILVQSHRQPLSGNRLVKISILFFFLVLTGIQLRAQEVDVSRSQVIEVIDGRKYYIHEIKPGQTVYSISKAYNITPDEIYKFNPDAKDLIKPSQMLKIPVWLVEREQKHQQEGEAAAKESRETESTEAAESKVSIHRVEKGETLYSIARKYNVRPEAIKDLNPEIVDILSPGQEVKVPVELAAGEPVRGQTQDNDTIILYEVQPGETLYRIAVDHDISVDDIIRMNPRVAEGLKAGDVIKLPRPLTTTIEKKSLAESGKNGFLKHKVEAGETLYSLSVRYSINIETLRHYNPQLADELKAGQVLKIPVDKAADGESTVFLPAEQEKDSLLFISGKDSLVKRCDSMNIKRSYRVALYMPLFLDHAGAIKLKDYEGEGKGWPEQEFKAFSYIHFYEGFKLALDSLEKQGLRADVFVYDTKGDAAVVKDLIRKDEFRTFDLIIGPFKPGLVQIVADAARPLSINVVSPVAYEMDAVIGNPHLIKLHPPVNYQIDRIVDFAAEQYRNANIIFVYSSTEKQAQLNKTVHKLLARKYGITDTVYPWHSIDYDKEGYGGVISKLKKGEHNVVFSMHKGEARINRLLTLLNGKREDYDITVFGSNTWEQYRSIESRYLDNLNYTSFTDFLVEYDDVRVKGFIRKFTDEYKTWPHRAAFKGFDVGYYFMKALFNYGTSFEYCMNRMDVFTMHNRFYFRKWETNAWQNSWMNIYQYRDFKRVNLVRDFITPDSGEKEPPLESSARD